MDEKVFNPMGFEKASLGEKPRWRREIPPAERMSWGLGALCIGLFWWEWASGIIHPFYFGGSPGDAGVEKHWRWSDVSSISSSFSRLFLLSVAKL